MATAKFTYRIMAGESRGYCYEIIDPRGEVICWGARLESLAGVEKHLKKIVKRLTKEYRAINESWQSKAIKRKEDLSERL